MVRLRLPARRARITIPLSISGRSFSKIYRQKPSDFLISPVPSETWELRAVRPSAEPAEHYYHPGGFHPVHLNEVCEQRYRIIRKLGYGSHSTAWLALDERESHYVALNFFAALPTQLSQVKDLMRTLQADPCAGSADSLVCPSVYDDLIVYGPNGRHPVTVMEALGQNLQEALDLYDVTAEKTGQHLDLRSKARIAKRMVELLHATHTRGIIHRAVEVRRFCYRLKDSIQHLSTGELDFHTRTWPSGNKNYLERKNRLPLGPHYPRYTVRPRPLQENSREQLCDGHDRLILIGFGHACRANRVVDERHDYPCDFLAPESAMSLSAPSQASDVWALGCSIFQLVTGCSPFSFRNHWEGRGGPGYLVHDMTRRLGPLPSRLIRDANFELPNVEEDSPLPLADTIYDLADPSATMEGWI